MQVTPQSDRGKQILREEWARVNKHNEYANRVNRISGIEVLNIE